ncbi:hypothetical protein Scep_017308 [Stephania cephalantha]|uniref:Uncharacterized protein n=1 Tax=Stephania cephalantha TaxID=152367 RepID=A0AAP0NVJ6_9MAGN
MAMDSAAAVRGRVRRMKGGGAAAVRHVTPRRADGGGESAREVACSAGVKGETAVRGSVGAGYNPGANLAHVAYAWGEQTLFPSFTTSGKKPESGWGLLPPPSSAATDRLRSSPVITGDEACASAVGTSGEGEAYPDFTSTFKPNVPLNSREEALT